MIEPAWWDKISRIFLDERVETTMASTLITLTATLIFYDFM